MTDRTRILCLLLAMTMTMGAYAQTTVRTLEPVEGVTVVYDDYDKWGEWPMGVRPMSTPSSAVEKRLDLSVLPEGMMDSLRAARVRIYFAAQDYSWDTPSIEANGLDEAFEIVVNGKSNRIAMDAGFPAKAGRKGLMEWGWVDFPIDATHLQPGENIIRVKKADEKGASGYDDYIYMGLDLTRQNGHSAFTEDSGKTWRTENLTARETTGE
ncbi:hypothetical protein HQ520_12900, partial [bacterium]|nr:hypothetical protein [bacterium]